MPPPRGGISIHIQRLMRTFNRRGIACDIIDESRVVTDGIPNLRRMSPLTYLNMIRRAELVHVHTSNRYVRLIHTLAARMLGTRVVHTVHGHHRQWLPRTCLRLACLLGQHRIAVSEAVAREIGMRADIIPAYINPGPEDEHIPDDVAAWMLEQQQAGRKLIAMNAYRPVKIDGVDLYGLDMLLDAFRRPDIRGKFAAVLCVANIDQDQPYFQEIRQRLQDEDMNGQIWLNTGQIEFAGVLKRADLFVRPTITDGDAVSIREALWYELPVVASDAVQRPEGVNVFKARDVAMFADKIMLSAEHAHRPANITDFAAKVADICEDLLQHHGRRRLPPHPARTPPDQ
jgi:glycosyltransferase involved in cell wall biosynthesis